MRLLEAYLFPALWIAFLSFWQIKAANVKATRRNEPAISRIARAVMFLSAVILLSYGGIPLRWVNWPLWPASNLAFWGGATITAAGLLFSIWARVRLGRNWSRSVTIKEDHELIVTGPYALVRHPIYTGLLTGFLGTAISVAELRGILALAIVSISLWAKLRLEERWMRSQFGISYEAYSSRVAALVPFLL